MDNTVILFNAIMRTYRNAMVHFIREKLESKFGDDADRQLQSAFKEDEWQRLRENAAKSRSEESGKIVQELRDEFELLGVERFFNLFEKHFMVFCPRYADVPKKERNSAKKMLCDKLRHIKAVRDPVSHPITDDIDYNDAFQTLACAKQILDFCELPEAARSILNTQSALLGGVSSTEEKIVTVLPPQEEVVVNFIGRHKELEFLQDWLEKRPLKRSGLSGEGGKGKSAIAYAFARSIATRTDHEFEAVIWMSAKVRRFIDGQTVRVDRPDFHDRKSAAIKILDCFGEPFDENDHAANEEAALQFLNDFPTLLIVDDIDTVEQDGEDAIEFLIMTVPERTRSRVLFTSRRAMFGLKSCTNQVSGLTEDDGNRFIRDRCTLMGIPMKDVIGHEAAILDVTDSSPLFMEDLLRLSQAGLQIQEAIGLWKEKRGREAREYAIRREYELLSPDSQQVLLALASAGSFSVAELSRGLNWPLTQTTRALEDLQKMFLMPKRSTSQDGKLTLNRNTQMLVLDVFDSSDAMRRTKRVMDAASGTLVTKRSEDTKVGTALRRFGLLCQQFKFEEAERMCADLIATLPGRHELHSAIAYAQMKQSKDVDARSNFQRSHDLGTLKTDTYWHWCDLEASQKEWNESARVAELGLKRFPNDAGMLFKFGYAKHRLAREFFDDGLPDAGNSQLKEAIPMLENAFRRAIEQSDHRRILPGTLRALILSAECQEDIHAMVTHFAHADRYCPDDHRLKTERERLGKRYAVLGEK